MREFDVLDNLSKDNLRDILISVSKSQKKVPPRDWFESQIKKCLNNGVCSCYSTRTEKRHLYDEFTGNVKGSYSEEVGICLGTRECDICKCKGNRDHCDFY